MGLREGKRAMTPNKSRPDGAWGSSSKPSKTWIDEEAVKTQRTLQHWVLPAQGVPLCFQRAGTVRLNLVPCARINFYLFVCLNSSGGGGCNVCRPKTGRKTWLKLLVFDAEIKSKQWAPSPFFFPEVVGWTCQEGFSTWQFSKIKNLWATNSLIFHNFAKTPETQVLSGCPHTRGQKDNNGDITILLLQHVEEHAPQRTTAVLHQHHLCGDLQYNRIRIWIENDITSTAKWLACSSGHLRYVQTSSSQQRTTLDICHLRQSGIRKMRSTRSCTSREPRSTSSSSHLSYLKVTHYLFGSWYLFTSTPPVTVTGPMTSTLGSLPLAQLPQYFRHLWHSTAGLKAQSLHQAQKPTCMPSASASATAYTSTRYFKNFNVIFNDRPSTSATSTLSTTLLPWQLQQSHWPHPSHPSTYPPKAQLHSASATSLYSTSVPST